jgi:hypothetical protein
MVGNELDPDDMLIEIAHFVDSMMIKIPARYRQSSTIILSCLLDIQHLQKN